MHSILGFWQESLLSLSPLFIYYHAPNKAFPHFTVLVAVLCADTSSWLIRLLSRDRVAYNAALISVNVVLASNYDLIPWYTADAFILVKIRHSPILPLFIEGSCAKPVPMWACVDNNTASKVALLSSVVCGVEIAHNRRPLYNHHHHHHACALKIR